MRVLIIEDDKILCESLVEYLKTKDIMADYPPDEREYFNYLNNYTYDVIILDLVLRYLKGEDILRQIRAKGISTPILILTSKENISDKETCFRYGADDYLTKPFNLRELVLRIKSLSNRSHIHSLIKIDNITVDIDAQVIYKDGAEVNFSKIAWNLFYLLLKHRGEIVYNDTIMGYVWGDKPSSDEIIRTYVKMLRKILPPNAISTYKGRGYKLNL
ncbi:response regulator transcription factor [Candidatus Magnetomonas plexicatena]|uniref:response regulator transcription factor n=1 Tax=Candidatus Magnetomonas plexicatena TaxID=2552947 RepID=UPI001104D024|nr:response regulator transcription factor [Nitrospirales bacterium LBB_01]